MTTKPDESRDPRDRFFMADRRTLSAMATESVHLPMAHRMHMLAMADVKNPVNQIEGGHTAYGNETLASKLPVIDKTTGKLKPAPRQTLRDAIDTLVKCGALDDGSEVRCLIVPNGVGKYGIGEKGCPYHGFDKSGGYVNPPF